MGIDFTSSSVDGHGDTMEEEFHVIDDENSLLAGRRPSIAAAGDLVD